MKDDAPDYAISIRQVKKQYKVYRRPLDAFWEIITKRSRHTEAWPLRGVDLTVRRGEVLGIVGKNGAGKSTLLKIIAGTLKQTTGEVVINGRVTAILELGSGFHPEYSGRDNIIMGGLCLGMSRAEVESKLESIIEFSELEDYIEQPFKTYSSGMQARLTFATAVSVDPDILIIDEALSVGDAKFQQKSFARIRRFREQGKTILLVSHDMNAITSFCDTAVILHNGIVQQKGDPKEISESYHRMLFGSSKALASDQEVNAMDAPESTLSSIVRTSGYGDKACEVVEVSLTGKRGDGGLVFNTSDIVTFNMRIVFNEDMDDPSCGIVIRDTRGMDIFGVTSSSYGKPIGARKKGDIVILSIGLTIWLARGDYFVTYGVAHGQGATADFHESGLHFRVEGDSKIFASSIVDLNPELSIAELAN